MFKFLKDFLFEENEVAVATPTATAAVTSMDEKMDQGARSEQPAGSMGIPTPPPLPDKPFWNEAPTPPAPIPVPRASVPTPPPAPIAVNKSIALDIQSKTEPDVQMDFTDEPAGGSGVIDLDNLPASEDIAPEPKMEEPEPVLTEEAPVMEMTKSEPAPEPAPMPIMEMAKPTPMSEPVKEVPHKSDEENDLEQIDQLMVKTKSEIEAEERAIADYELEATIIADKLAVRRSKLSALKTTPGELEKTKADLEILLHNKKEVEDKIMDIRSQLSGSRGSDEMDRTA